MVTLIISCSSGLRRVLTSFIPCEGTLRVRTCSENAGHAAQAVADPGIVDILLWGVLPYVALVVLIGGTFGVTVPTSSDGLPARPRSMNRSCCALLRPLFHYGLAGRFPLVTLWCLVVSSFTDLVLSEDAYHVMALVVGSAAAIATIVGMLPFYWSSRFELSCSFGTYTR